MRKTRSEIAKHTTRILNEGRDAPDFRVTITIPRITLTATGTVEDADGYPIVREEAAFDFFAEWIQDSEGVSEMIIDSGFFSWGDLLASAIDDSSYALEVEVAE